MLVAYTLWLVYLYFTFLVIKSFVCVLCFYIIGRKKSSIQSSSIAHTPLYEEKDEYDAGGDSSGIDSPVLSSDIMPFDSPRIFTEPRCKSIILCVCTLRCMPYSRMIS